jgi:hypothetical protein
MIPARAEPALFEVGFAVRNLDPSGCAACRPEGQFLGGFGYDDPVTVVNDPLEVRAMAISSGTKTVLLAIVDTQGWFAGNQEGPWGNRDAREHAAAALGLSPADIVISSTHSHAAPTIMGIWGSTDPAYLEYVHDQTVAALVEAGTPANMRAAELLAAEADVGDTTISAIEQTDGYQGWRIDGRTPVLWARDPATKATLGLYANVPVHADIVNGVGLDLISADHIGVERRLLDRDLGGTSVIAMGTLGRQEAIVQTDGLAAAGRVGRYVVNEIERALASARLITDPTLASAEQYVVVPGTNPLLAALNYGNAAPNCPCDVGGVAWTIDRALTPPFLVGGAFGTWITALRIGDVVYATQPGEGFPEVSTGIRKAFGGIDVRIVGMAQDQLGYYYPPETYPFTFTNPTDHHIYNASLLLGEVNVQAHALNASALGLNAMPNHETNQFDDPLSTLEAGMQWFPDRREGVSPTFELTAYTSEAAYTDLVPAVTLDNLGEGGECPKAITWSFGATKSDGGCGYVQTHTFPGPGTYEVTATTIDARTGNAITWTSTLIVNGPLSATVARSGDTLTAGVSGGQGTILAAHWTFDDATTAHGLVITKPNAHGTVEVVDGAGNHATTTF